MSSYIIVFDSFRNEIIHNISKLSSLIYCMYKYTDNIYIYVYVCMYNTKMRLFHLV